MTEPKKEAPPAGTQQAGPKAADATREGDLLKLRALWEHIERLTERKEML